MSKRNIMLYIQDIKDAVMKIERYTQDMSYEQFRTDDKTIDAVVRNIQNIGEAVKNIPDDLIGHYPNIPWTEIAGMRDKIVHQYFGVAIEVVWDTVQRNIPELKNQIEKVQYP